MGTAADRTAFGGFGNAGVNVCVPALLLSWGQCMCKPACVPLSWACVCDPPTLTFLHKAVFVCVSAGTWQQSRSRYLLVLSSASGLSPTASQLGTGQLLHTSPHPSLSQLHCPCWCALVGPRSLQLASTAWQPQERHPVGHTAWCWLSTSSAAPLLQRPPRRAHQPAVVVSFSYPHQLRGSWPPWDHSCTAEHPHPHVHASGLPMSFPLPPASLSLQPVWLSSPGSRGFTAAPGSEQNPPD